MISWNLFCNFFAAHPCKVDAHPCLHKQCPSYFRPFALERAVQLALHANPADDNRAASDVMALAVAILPGQ